MMRAEGPIMFAEQIDHRARASAIPPEPPENLRDISKKGRERRWRERNLAKRAIADSYRALGYDDLARRMENCATELAFDHVRIRDGEEFLAKRSRGQPCRGRLCPICQPELSRRRLYEYLALFDVYFQRYPNHRALLLTTTMRTVPGEGLPAALRQLADAFKKLTRRTRFKRAFKGWIRTCEVVRSQDTGYFQPHLHAILTAPPSYFQRRNRHYIDQKSREWSSLWRACLGVDYDPIVDIRAVKNLSVNPDGTGLTEEARGAVFEVAKYCTKPNAVISFGRNTVEAVDLDGLRALHTALHGRRLVGKGGLLRVIARELGHADDDGDTCTAERVPEGLIWLGRKRFAWVPDADGVGGSYELVEVLTDPFTVPGARSVG